MNKDSTKNIRETNPLDDKIQDDSHSLMLSEKLPTSDQARVMGNRDSDDFPIVVDSATSWTITPFFDDLIGPQLYKSNLKGIGSGK